MYIFVQTIFKIISLSSCFVNNNLCSHFQCGSCETLIILLQLFPLLWKIFKHLSIRLKLGARGVTNSIYVAWFDFISHLFLLKYPKCMSDTCNVFMTIPAEDEILNIRDWSKLTALILNFSGPWSLLHHVEWALHYINDAYRFCLTRILRRIIHSCHP